MRTLQKRYSLIDFFETWFQVVPKAIAPILVVATIGLIPGSILVGLGFGPYLEWLGDLVLLENGGAVTDPQEIWVLTQAYLPHFAPLVYGVVLLGFGFFYASLTTQYVLLAQSRGEDPSLPTVLGAVFPRIFFSGFLAGFLQFLILMGALIVFSIFVGIVGAVIGVVGYLESGSPDKGMVTGIVNTLSGVSSLVLFVLANYFVFVQPAVVGGTRGGRAIGESFKLVRKQFWRILGIRLVVSLVVGVASGVIFLLPSFLLLLPGFLEVIPLLSDPDMLSQDPSLIFQAFRGLGVSMIVLSILGSTFQLTIDPVFNLMLHQDQLVRKNLAPDLTLPPADDLLAPETT